MQLRGWGTQTTRYGRHDRPAPGYYPYFTRRQSTVRHLRLRWRYRSPAPSPPQSPPTTPHRKRCLRGKTDFAGSAEFPANTAFAARAAIAVAAARCRQRCGRGGASRTRHPRATPDRVPHPPHPPRGRRLDFPYHFPPSPAMAPASPNYLTRNAWCLRTHPGFPTRHLLDPPPV